MHELWICRNILEIIKESASGKACTQIKVIHLEIGELVAVEKSSLLFGFEVISKGTIAEDAILKFIDIPGQAWCVVCKNVIKISRYDQACKFCGNCSLSIMKGEELRIKSMEVK